MSKEKETEPEELPEEFKILEKAIQNYEKLAYEEKKGKIIEKAEDQKLEKIDLEQEIQDFKTYFDFILQLLISMLNPTLKKNNIEPISIKEINELKEAILLFITEKLIGGSSAKITEFLAKLVNLPKIFKLITSIWKIFFPRITKYFEDKKKLGAIPSNL